jgi:hypothetical protein
MRPSWRRWVWPGLAGLLAMMILLAIEVWWFLPQIQTLHAVSRISFVGSEILVDRQPVRQKLHLLNLNSYSNGVSNEEIEAVFDEAARSLFPRAQQIPRYVYREDPMTYPRLCAVWDLPSGYVEVATGAGNDSDYINLTVGQGRYPIDQTVRLASRSELRPVLWGR